MSFRLINIDYLLRIHQREEDRGNCRERRPIAAAFFSFRLFF